MEAAKSVYGSTIGEILSETLVDKKFPGAGGYGANHEARDLAARPKSGIPHCPPRL
jgi:hypothetical protein